MQKEFLNLIQKEFPISKRPFEDIAKILKSSEEEILNLYKKLKEEKIIRQTSAIFDTKSLGYRSSLVAFRLENIDECAKFINTHPGVSHNYERNHEFNLWFTLAVPPNSKLGLEKTIELMAKVVKAKEYIILPTKKMFKISVQLDIKGNKAKKEKLKAQKRVEIELKPIHYELIKLLQEDIKPMKEPFKKVVETLNIDYDFLKQETDLLKQAGYMRRFASILYHRRAGFQANAMVVWKIPEENVEKIGQKVAEYSAVSHCYQRPTYPNWPYSLFSMIHGRSKNEVENIVQEISKEIGINEYKYLYSTKEFKKIRVKYFSDEFEKWEKTYG